jgi:hypothetical protein
MSTERVYERVNTEMDRFDRCIEEAEARIEAQEQLIREATLLGCSARHEIFDLEKMQLLLAILREARSRLLGHPKASV